MKAIAALQLAGMPILVLDDSTTAETERALVRQANPSVFYHGPTEQRRIMQLTRLDDRAMVLGQNSWHLPGSCRNYAVLMARACGLERILLIDDDIVVEDPRLPNQTLSLLDASVLCVGALTVGKPDDSVTGHLARSVDWDAPRFVSGQYLALQTAFVSAPFPDTYNEDWLLILMNVGRRRIVSHSAVTQIVSEPRLTLLETALFQEFGEVASEGAIVALHSSASLLDQGTPFWWTSSWSGERVSATCAAT